MNCLSLHEAIKYHDEAKHRAIFMFMKVRFMVVQEIEKCSYKEKKNGQEKSEDSKIPSYAIMRTGTFILHCHLFFLFWQMVNDSINKKVECQVFF